MELRAKLDMSLVHVRIVYTKGEKNFIIMRIRSQVECETSLSMAIRANFYQQTVFRSRKKFGIEDLQI